jgi:hypothetical protein
MLSMASIMISVDLEQVVTQTKQFVLEIEKVVDTLNSEKVSQLQKKLNFLATR